MVKGPVLPCAGFFDLDFPLLEFFLGRPDYVNIPVFPGSSHGARCLGLVVRPQLLQLPIQLPDTLLLRLLASFFPFDQGWRLQNRWELRDGIPRFMNSVGDGG